jgi:hypothetical protein
MGGREEAWHDEAVRALQSSPRIIKSPAGMPMQSPWLQILNKQAGVDPESLQVSWGSLGLTSACSVELADVEEDPADRFFGPA